MVSPPGYRCSRAGAVTIPSGLTCGARSVWKAVAIFSRRDERFDHLRLFVVAAELVQLLEPEYVAAIIRVTPQVTEILSPQFPFSNNILTRIRRQL